MSDEETQNQKKKNQQGNAENQNQNKKNQQGTIILGVNIHCEGCANEVLKHLRGFEGVEEVEIDAANHKVTVKGKTADPTKVQERLRKKSGKHVELISPKPQKPQQKKEEKPPKLEVKEVELKIYIHCEGCAKEIKHCIFKMEGVQTVDPDAGKNTVKVKGTMDPKKLVEFVNKRGGRHAEIVKQTQTKQKKSNEPKPNQNIVHSYPQQVYAPQFFSDENPNACSLM